MARRKEKSVTQIIEEARVFILDECDVHGFDEQNLLIILGVVHRCLRDARNKRVMDVQDARIAQLEKQYGDDKV